MHVPTEMHWWSKSGFYWKSVNTKSPAQLALISFLLAVSGEQKDQMCTRVHQLVDISGKEEANEELRSLCCCFAYVIDKIRVCSLLIFLSHKYVKLVVRSCLEGRILSWKKYREKYKMSGLVTVHPIVLWRTQSEPSHAVYVSTVDGVTFLNLKVGSPVPDKKQSGNPVEHFYEGHNGPVWKLFLLNLHGLVWR